MVLNSSSAKCDRCRVVFLQLLSLSSIIFFFDMKDASAYQLCKNLESPKAADATLEFCSNPEYSLRGCCTAERDKALSAIFQGYNVPMGACSILLQNLTCAECDAWSADLLGASEYSAPRAFPYLCSANSSVIFGDFCEQVWVWCKDTEIQNSPFAAGQNNLAGGTSTTLSSLFESVEAFCNATAPEEPSSPCFEGGPYHPPPQATLSIPSGICYERIATKPYIGFVPHPDGNRAFILRQQGEIFLVPIPAPGRTINESGAPLFLNLTTRVLYEGEMGLLGFALHPNFVGNGRFFVSYSCNAAVHPDCVARCPCDNATGCAASRPVFPAVPTGLCRFASVVAEYSALDANGMLTDSANPTEVRRIWTMGHPFSNHNGGDIHFGPVDGFLYFTMGDGGSQGDPFNFSQNLGSPLGKIHRIDIDFNRTGSVPATVGQWGSYSIPWDNPFVGQEGALPEIWAYGFRNPWRCSFDSARPWYLLCGDVGQDRVEEVNLIVKGGNYGWNAVEGTLLYKPPDPTTNDTSRLNLINPIVEYNRSESGAPASVTGGYVYRGLTDTCLYGLYLFNDLFGANFVAVESPPDSGLFTKALIPTKCANSTAAGCPEVDKKFKGVVAQVWAYGEDYNKNLYALGASGIMRVVNPNLCGWSSCQTVDPLFAPPLPPLRLPPSPPMVVPSPTPAPVGYSPSTSFAARHSAGKGFVLLLLCVVGMVVNFYLGPQAAAAAICLLVIKFAPTLLPPPR